MSHLVLRGEAFRSPTVAWSVGGIMNIIGNGLGALTLAAAVALGGAADAAIMRATFAGVTANITGIEYDGLGLFGPPGAVDPGTQWSAVFVYDTSDPIDGCTCIMGGGATLWPSPFLSATFSLSAVDFPFGPADGDYGIASLDAPPDHLALSYDASFSAGRIFLYLDALSAYPHGIDNLATPWSRTGGTYGYGVFERVNDLRTAATEIGLIVNSVSIAPVPEPSTWALLILGFGAVGATLRQRRRLAA